MLRGIFMEISKCYLCLIYTCGHEVWMSFVSELLNINL